VTTILSVKITKQRNKTCSRTAEKGGETMDNNNDMLLDIDDDDETHEQSNGLVNGNHAMRVDSLLGNGGSTVNESAGIPPKRPTRETVLKRLSEALMRRTLTKVSSDTDL
jgi:hypothetical protein